MSMILCPVCKSPESKVVEHFDYDGGVRRRRRCDQCGCRYTTMEIAVPDGKYKRRMKLLQEAAEA